MYLVDKNGIRARCVRCERLAPVKSRREKLHGVCCEECRADMLETIMADYRRQIEAGAPKGRRWVLIPTGPGLYDERFDVALRKAIKAADSEPARVGRIAI
jgi:hypothetical protein